MLAINGFSRLWLDGFGKPGNGVSVQRIGFGEAVGAGGVLRNLRHLHLQGIYLLLQLKDPCRVLLDHLTDQIGIGREVGAALPGRNGVGIGGANARDLEQTVTA